MSLGAKLLQRRKIKRNEGVIAVESLILPVTRSSLLDHYSGALSGHVSHFLSQRQNKDRTAARSVLIFLLLLEHLNGKTLHDVLENDLVLLILPVFLCGARFGYSRAFLGDAYSRG